MTAASRARRRDRIPLELRQRDQWVVWRSEDRDGKATKVPYRADGLGLASTTDRESWASFEAAVAAIGALAMSGVGYVFARDDPYSGIDLDAGLRDDERDWVVATLDSYSERSVSGNGVHVIVRASLNGHGSNRRGPFEVYEHGRYFVVTGDHVAGTPATIGERQEQLDLVLARFLPKPAPVEPLAVSPVDVGDRELLDTASAATGGADFDALYRGVWEGRYPSQSEADLALCRKLAFWTGRDGDRIDRLFRSSGLMRDKWDRPDYRQRTIDAAIAACKDVYSPRSAAIAAAPEPAAHPYFVRDAISIGECRAIFQRWLHLPDTGALDAVLATIATNRLPGDPVWLLLVGPPGGGKSEILVAASPLPDTYPAATITEAALLSGTPKRENAPGAKGGLLRNIGAFGIIVVKDFGSVLSMNRDARALVLAALREVYDGSWTRHVGTDGGRTLSWAGKVGLVGGCTPTIDRHHAVMGAMGERFLLYRLPEVDPDTQARQALGHAGREKQMRSELAAAVQAVLAGAKQTPRERDEEETTRLVSLATLVVRARSAVERDGYSREIELVPGAEAPTRLIIVLDRLLAGLDVIGVEREQAWRVVTKAALDSVPALRLALLYALEDGTLDTNDLAAAIRHPATTTRRALEDLTAHGLVECERQGEGKAHRWTLSDFTRQRLATFPEMSSSTQSERIRGFSALQTDTDKSGTVTPEAKPESPQESPEGQPTAPVEGSVTAAHLDARPVSSSPPCTLCDDHYDRDERGAGPLRCPACVAVAAGYSHADDHNNPGITEAEHRELRFIRQRLHANGWKNLHGWKAVA